MGGAMRDFAQKIIDAIDPLAAEAREIAMLDMPLRTLAHHVQRYIRAERSAELHGLTDIWLDVVAAADALPPIEWPK
jgi:hypothetical protein